MDYSNFDRQDFFNLVKELESKRHLPLVERFDAANFAKYCTSEDHALAIYHLCNQRIIIDFKQLASYLPTNNQYADQVRAYLCEKNAEDNIY